MGATFSKKLQTLSGTWVLVARNAQNDQQVEFLLLEPSYVLGRATRGDEGAKLSLDFDATLSREHATVTVEASGVTVSALKNRQPLFVNGEARQSLRLGPGDRFRSGFTDFELRVDLSDALTVDACLTQERLEQAQNTNPREILEAILKIQPLLAAHRRPEELFVDLLPLLSEVVPGASVLLAIRVGADGSQQLLHSHGLEGRVAEPSQTLLRRCLNEEQAIYHIWSDKPASGGPTALIGASWALAAPILCHPDSYVLYSLGLEHLSHSTHSRPSQLDRSVLALVADLISKHLQGNRASVLATQVEAERERRILSDNLRHLTRSVSSSLDPRVVLENLLAYLHPLVAYETGGGFLLVQGEFRAQARRGSCPRPWPNWPARFVLREGAGEAVCLAADSAEAELLGLIDQPHWLLLTLLSQNEVQGLVALGRSAPFSAEQIEVSVAFASQVGMALHNARLFARVRSQAIQDELTGLFNRRHFFELARRRWAESEECSLVLFDIDRFKSVNDQHGHDVGDLALKHVAQTFRDLLRAEETLARLGGEEFVVIVPGTLQQAAQAAERWRRALETCPCRVNPESALVLTVSLGVATRRPSPDRVEDALKRADVALYRAKESGRNQVQSAP